MAHIKQPVKIKHTYSVYNWLKTKMGKTIWRLTYPPVNNEINSKTKWTTGRTKTSKNCQQMLDQ